MSALLGAKPLESSSLRTDGVLRVGSGGATVALALAATVCFPAIAIPVPIGVGLPLWPWIPPKDILDLVNLLRRSAYDGEATTPSMRVFAKKNCSLDTNKAAHSWREGCKESMDRSVPLQKTLLMEGNKARAADDQPALVLVREKERAWLFLTFPHSTFNARPSTVNTNT